MELFSSLILSNSQNMAGYIAFRIQARLSPIGVNWDNLCEYALPQQQPDFPQQQPDLAGNL